METTFSWNMTLFHLINAGEGANDALVAIARIVAVYAPWLVILITVTLWLLGTPTTRRALMIAGVALGLGLCTNFTLAWATYAPRPFELGLGHTLLAHAHDSSFPSDHATFLWSLSFGLLIGGSLRWLGGGIFVIGLATAWARVFLGVHFPLDMAGAFAISLLAALLAHGVSEKLDEPLFQTIERFNARLLRPLMRAWGRPNER